MNDFEQFQPPDEHNQKLRANVHPRDHQNPEPASKSDTQVAARSLETGIWGAYQNVLINMDGIDDDSFKTSILSEAEIIMSTAQEKCAQVLRILEEAG